MSIRNWGRRKHFGLAALAGLAADPSPAPVAAEAKKTEKLAKDARRVVTGFVAGKTAQSENFSSNGLRLDINGKPFATRNAPNTDTIRVCPGNVNTVAQRQAANAILTATKAGVSIVPRSAKDSTLAIGGRKGRRGMNFAPKGGCFEVHIGRTQRARAAENFVVYQSAAQQDGTAVPSAKTVAKVRKQHRAKVKATAAAHSAEQRVAKLNADLNKATEKVMDVMTKPGSDKGRAGRVAQAKKAVEKLDKKLTSAQKTAEKARAKVATLPA